VGPRGLRARNSELGGPLNKFYEGTFLHVSFLSRHADSNLLVSWYRRQFFDFSSRKPPIFPIPKNEQRRNLIG